MKWLTISAVVFFAFWGLLCFADDIPGKPLTSVVITQCNMIVAVYVTMPDGRLVRFDKSSDVPAINALAMASSAAHSERIEVKCDEH